MLPMLTIVGYVSQYSIIYKCTKLHNHSLTLYDPGIKAPHSDSLPSHI